MQGGDNNNPRTNSFASYVYHHGPHKLGKSKFLLSSGTTKQVDLDICSPVSNIEFDHSSVSFPQDLQSQSTEQYSDSSSDGSEESSSLFENPFTNDEDEAPAVEGTLTTTRDSLKVLAGMIRQRHVSTINLFPELQMLMDLYLRTIGRGASLSTFDDVLQWALDHTLIDHHVPTWKPLFKQIAKAVYGKEYLKHCKPK
jgi:hypothetical protein